MKRNLGNGNKDLRDYRIIQAAFAINRDDGYCVRCYWMGKLKQYEHVHHVFGRGTEVGDVREQYISLLCLCFECHNLYRPIRTIGKEKHQAQINMLAWANKTPVNSRFTNPESLRSDD